MLEVSEMYEAPQGEGRFIGRQSLYIRMNRCPLKCVWCDTKFTWDENDPEYGKGVTTYATPGKLVDAVLDLTGNKKPLPMAFVFTGGEPMIYQDTIAAVIDGLRMKLPRPFAVEMETSGFITPNTRILRKGVHFNVSHKLPGSENFHVEPHKLLNAEGTVVFMKTDADFKVVVSRADRDEDIEKYLEYLNGMAYRADIEWEDMRERVYLMPEGTTGFDIRMRQPRVLALAQRLGVMATTRMHITAYDDKRGK